MTKPQQDGLLQRGVWLLVVGVFTSWLFGVGLLFILAAAVCGFVGLFREQILRSAILLTSSLVLGGICFVVALHVTAIAGIYAFNNIKSGSAPEPAAAAVSTARHGK